MTPGINVWWNVGGALGVVYYGLAHLDDAGWTMPFVRCRLGDAVWAPNHLGDQSLGRCRLGNGPLGR